MIRYLIEKFCEITGARFNYFIIIYYLTKTGNDKIVCPRYYYLANRTLITNRRWLVKNMFNMPNIATLDKEDRDGTFGIQSVSYLGFFKYKITNSLPTIKN